jgi:hypothetical protein
MGVQDPAPRAGESASDYADRVLKPLKLEVATYEKSPWFKKLPAATQEKIRKLLSGSDSSKMDKDPDEEGDSEWGMKMKTKSKKAPRKKDPPPAPKEEPTDAELAKAAAAAEAQVKADVAKEEDPTVKDPNVQVIKEVAEQLPPIPETRQVLVAPEVSNPEQFTPGKAIALPELELTVRWAAKVETGLQLHVTEGLSRNSYGQWAPKQIGAFKTPDEFREQLFILLMDLASQHEGLFRELPKVEEMSGMHGGKLLFPDKTHRGFDLFSGIQGKLNQTEGMQFSDALGTSSIAVRPLPNTIAKEEFPVVMMPAEIRFRQDLIRIEERKLKDVKVLHEFLDDVIVDGQVAMPLPADYGPDTHFTLYHSDFYPYLKLMDMNTQFRVGMTDAIMDIIVRATVVPALHPGELLTQLRQMFTIRDNVASSASELPVSIVAAPAAKFLKRYVGLLLTGRWNVGEYYPSLNHHSVLTYIDCIAMMLLFPDWMLTDASKDQILRCLAQMLLYIEGVTPAVRLRLSGQALKSMDGQAAINAALDPTNFPRKVRPLISMMAPFLAGGWADSGQSNPVQIPRHWHTLASPRMYMFYPISGSSPVGPEDETPRIIARFGSFIMAASQLTWNFNKNRAESGRNMAQFMGKLNELVENLPTMYWVIHRLQIGLSPVSVAYPAGPGEDSVISNRTVQIIPGTEPTAALLAINYERVRLGELLETTLRRGWAVHAWCTDFVSNWATVNATFTAPHYKKAWKLEYAKKLVKYSFPFGDEVITNVIKNSALGKFPKTIPVANPEIADRIVAAQRLVYNNTTAFGFSPRFFYSPIPRPHMKSVAKILWLASTQSVWDVVDWARFVRLVRTGQSVDHANQSRARTDSVRYNIPIMLKLDKVPVAKKQEVPIPTNDTEDFTVKPLTQTFVEIDSRFNPKQPSRAYAEEENVWLVENSPLFKLAPGDLISAPYLGYLPSFKRGVVILESFGRRKFQPDTLYDLEERTAPLL